MTRNLNIVLVIIFILNPAMGSIIEQGSYKTSFTGLKSNHNAIKRSAGIFGDCNRVTNEFANLPNLNDDELMELILKLTYCYGKGAIQFAIIEAF